MNKRELDVVSSQTIPLNALSLFQKYSHEKAGYVNSNDVIRNLKLKLLLSESTQMVDEGLVTFEAIGNCQYLNTNRNASQEIIFITMSSDESFTNRLAYHQDLINVTESRVVTLPLMNPYYGKELYIHVKFAHGNQVTVQNIKLLGLQTVRDTRTTKKVTAHSTDGKILYVQYSVDYILIAQRDSFTSYAMLWA
jgi:hypothetical protein